MISEWAWSIVVIGILRPVYPSCDHRQTGYYKDIILFSWCQCAWGLKPISLFWILGVHTPEFSSAHNVQGTAMVNLEEEELGQSEEATLNHTKGNDKNIEEDWGWLILTLEEKQEGHGGPGVICNYIYIWVRLDDWDGTTKRTSELIDKFQICSTWIFDGILWDLKCRDKISTSKLSLNDFSIPIRIIYIKNNSFNVIVPIPEQRCASKLIVYISPWHSNNVRRQLHDAVLPQKIITKAIIERNGGYDYW